MKRVSYAITTHDETYTFAEMLKTLGEHADLERDEIVICDDHSTNETTLKLLDEAEMMGAKVHRRQFDGHFADQKNALRDLCEGEYIFSLDADEVPSRMLIKELDRILQHGMDAYALARVNIVDGITQDHIKAWNWSINPEGWVNWPDWQVRIYRNSCQIKWQGSVHERVQGFKEFMYLPRDKGFALLHHKDISTQEKQNALYEKLIEGRFLNTLAPDASGKLAFEKVVEPLGEE